MYKPATLDPEGSPQSNPTIRQRLLAGLQLPVSTEKRPWKPSDSSLVVGHLDPAVTDRYLDDGDEPHFISAPASQASDDFLLNVVIIFDASLRG